MSDNIPFEIQLEIIKRVPDVKSLIRFRSVSKPWKSFIDSSEFISGYGTRDTQPHSLLLRYIDNVYPYEVKYVSFVDDVSFPQQQQDFAPNVSDLVKRFRALKVIGSSCGLWSLETKDTVKWQVEIFTLSSKTWKMIPSSNLPRESITFQFSTQVAIDKFIYWLAFDKIVTNDDGYNNKVSGLTKLQVRVRHTQPHRLLLSYKEASDPREVNYPSFADDVSFPRRQQEFAPNVSDLVKQFHDLIVIGNSCGLWFFHGCKNFKCMIVIWNPSIRKSVIVMPHITNTSLNDFDFGVCPSTNDPTIVVISMCFQRKNKNNITWIDDDDIDDDESSFKNLIL
nr:hypothetical protein [Tanacetum cinerariifolium]